MIRATYGVEGAADPVEAAEIERSRDFICREADRRGAVLPRDWSVVLNFVHWDDATAISGPLVVSVADCD